MVTWEGCIIFNSTSAEMEFEVNIPKKNEFKNDYYGRKFAKNLIELRNFGERKENTFL